MLQNKDSHKDSALNNSPSPCAPGGEMKRNTEVPYAGTMADAMGEREPDQSHGSTASSVRCANDLAYHEYSSNGLYLGARATCRRECNLVHSLLTLISSPVSLSLSAWDKFEETLVDLLPLIYMWCSKK